MNIGLLTYHCPPNFGAQLQSVSTVGFLRNLGHNVVVLNWYPQDLEAMYAQRIPNEQVVCHQQFADQNLPLSPLLRNEQEVIEQIEHSNLDAIVVGSDALFKYKPEKLRRHFSKRRLRYIVSPPSLSVMGLSGNVFFGAFIAKLNKTLPVGVYAVSSQNTPYQEMTRHEEDDMRTAMSHFSFISVRDKWTQMMVQHITHRSFVPIYPDPVFAFNSNSYLTVPSKAEILSKYNLSANYVLLSFSDWYCKSAYIADISRNLSARGLQPVALPMPEKLFNPGIAHHIELPLSPIDWYALIIHSRGYIGERMHPIVVCLHNAVPFYSFDEYGVKRTKGLFPFNKKVYDPLSSKTHTIVAEAGLLDNLYSYQSTSPFPLPSAVVDGICHFDADRCRAFSQAKYKEYKQGMAHLLATLSQ